MNPLYLGLAAFGGYFVFEHMNKEPVGDAQVPMDMGQTTSKFVPTTGRISLPLVSTYPAKLTNTVKPSGAGLPKNPGFVNALKNGSFMKANLHTLGAHQQMIDKGEKYLKEQYDKLSTEAKKAGAEWLNENLKPSPNVKPTDDWKTASKKVGAAVGSVAGASAAGGACAPVGLSAPCATLGAMAGAYLGGKLGPILAGKWKELELWAQGTAERVADRWKRKAGEFVDRQTQKAIDAVKFW